MKLPEPNMKLPQASMNVRIVVAVLAVLLLGQLHERKLITLRPA